MAEAFKQWLLDHVVTILMSCFTAIVISVTWYVTVNTTLAFAQEDRAGLHQSKADRAELRFIEKTITTEIEHAQSDRTHMKGELKEIKSSIKAMDRKHDQRFQQLQEKNDKRFRELLQQMIHFHATGTHPHE